MPETRRGGFDSTPRRSRWMPRRSRTPDEPRGGRRGRARCRAVPGVLAAVAPTIGTARVASATGKIVGMMCLPDPTPSAPREVSWADLGPARCAGSPRSAQVDDTHAGAEVHRWRALAALECPSGRGRRGVTCGTTTWRGPVIRQPTPRAARPTCRWVIFRGCPHQTFDPVIQVREMLGFTRFERCGDVARGVESDGRSR
jgi:hypothetical protein